MKNNQMNIGDENKSTFSHFGLKYYFALCY